VVTKLMLVAFAATLVGSCAATGAVGTPDRPTRRDALRAAGTFAAVLSERADLDALVRYDAVFLDPAPYRPADLDRLRAAGTLALGYVNVGEVEAWRPFADRVDPAWVLGENPDWEGHRFVDAREAGWREIVVGTAARAVEQRGFDGLFLDMADVAVAYPETADGVVALVRELRAAYPDLVLVMNRGFPLLGRLEGVLDGLLVEGVWVRADLASGGTAETPPAERETLLGHLHAFRRAGGAVFVIDYAQTADQTAAVRAAARREGLPVFVGDVALGRLRRD
jgi:uncharacterized protein (TIGR01370 family)